MSQTKKVTRWEVDDQRGVVLIEIEGKIHQVSLDEEQMKSLIFILPQLFDDHKIKIVEKELNDIYFENK